MGTLEESYQVTGAESFGQICGFSVRLLNLSASEQDDRTSAVL